MHLLPRVLASLVALTLSACVFAQGSLTPPGAPAPSMKSLEQLDVSLTALAAKSEARVAVQDLTGDATAVYVISAPGSYYLRGNINGVAGRSGIKIAASNVALDLNGFALVGIVSSLDGIAINPGFTRVVVRNGAITNWANGITGTSETLLTDLNLGDFAGSGVSLFGSGIAREVHVRDCGATAINVALAENCTVDNVDSASTAYGIQAALARGCRVINVFTGAQAYGIQSSMVVDCVINGIHGTTVTYGVHGGTTNDAVCSKTRVENVDSSTTSATGISAQNISDCVVRKIVGVTGASGGAGRLAQNLSAYDVSCSGTGATLGYSGTEASNCSVRLISSSGGTAYGISANTIAGCNLQEISGNLSYGAFAYTVAHCQISLVTGTGSSVTGISADQVSDCRISSLNAQTSVYGIDAVTVSKCSISNFTGGVAATTVTAGIRAQSADGCDVRNGDFGIATAPRGIQAVNVTQCTVSSLESNANVSLYGILGGVVSKCTVDDVDNINAGGSARGTGISAIATSIGGQNATITENLITGCSHYGIQLANTSRIVGNSLRSNGTAGIAVTLGCVVTDNQTNGHTTGIVVSGGGNFVARNVSYNDTTAFSIAAGNRAGAIAVGAGAATDPLANCDL